MKIQDPAPLYFHARLVLFSLLVTSVLLFQACAGPTKKTRARDHEKTATVKTTFEKNARLSPAELAQVVELALQCGIPDVVSIETFYYLPITTKGIVAKSSERVDGRNISYDTVYLGNSDWESLSEKTTAKRLGKFWVNEPFKSTTLLREYVFYQQKVRVKLGKGIDTEFADQVFALFGAGKLRFENRFVQDQYKRIKLEEVSSISKSWSGDGYELLFDKSYPMKGVHFKPGLDEILVTGISSIVI